MIRTPRLWRVLAGVLAAAEGCAVPDPLDRMFGPDGRTIREEIATYPPEQREAFALTQRRCTKCHSLDEVFAAHLPEGMWRSQVRKMVRKPGAGIPETDADRIASFLESFSDRRRAAIEAGKPR